MKLINQGTIKVYPQEAYDQFPSGCKCFDKTAADCDWCQIYYYGIPCGVPRCMNVVEVGTTICSSCATKQIVPLEEQLAYNTHRDEDHWLLRL
jgi:hypothetical protein